MALTETQRTTLAVHIRANLDPVIVAALLTRTDNVIKDWYNDNSTFVVWRKNIPASEMGKTVIYNALASMTSANTERVSLFMALNTESFAGSSDLDAYFDNTFSGALGGSGADCRAALAAMLRRSATRAENVFTTGTGTTNNPGTLVFEGEISNEDVGRALNDNP